MPHEQRSGDDAAARPALVGLRHGHLPKLSAAGLIETVGDSTVRLNAAHPAFEDPGVVEAIAGPGAGSLVALFRTLAVGRNRTILDALSHQFGPIHVETLTREVAARAEGVPESAVPDETLERVTIGLHHANLPRLSASDLIDHDVEEGTVVYRGDPALPGCTPSYTPTSGRA